MALKPCKECGASVSDKAQTCPQCGAKQTKKTSPFVIFLAILLAIAGVYSLVSSEPEPSPVVENKPVTEEDILMQKFSDAARAKNLDAKCQASRDLLDFYIKQGDKGKADMAKDILKRDCK